MGNPPAKYSLEWFANQGHEDGQKGHSHAHWHDGMLDRMIGISDADAEKRDAYDKAWHDGRAERDRGHIPKDE